MFSKGLLFSRGRGFDRRLDETQVLRSIEMMTLIITAGYVFLVLKQPISCAATAAARRIVSFPIFQSSRC
jgi:hypothetical protein